MSNAIHYTELMALTTKEHAEWEANGLGFKKNFKRKVKALKAGIKARRSISQKDYRALLADRERRLNLIRMARPILMDGEKLARIGASEQTQREFFGEIQKSEELNGGLKSAVEALDAMKKGVVEHGLTREEFRRKTSNFTLGMSSFEKGELCIDWVIWRLKPYLEAIALRFGFKEADDLDEHRMKLIVEAVNNGYTYYAPAPGRGGYQWNVTEEQAEHLVRAFPNIAQFIRDGIVR